MLNDTGFDSTVIQQVLEKRRGKGLASMSPEKKREIASKGGKAAHSLGTAHKFTSEEARAAGRIGGSRGHAGKGKRKREAREKLNAYFLSTEE